MKTKHFFISWCLLVLTSSIFAQHTAFENLNPLAPNAQEFQKYGEYPVGYYTGVPNISIPLYTIRSGDIEVPITLSYHASGIKTDQEASWVGLGWSLNAGGSVSKQVKHYNDFDCDIETNTAFGEVGYYEANNELIELTASNKSNENFTTAQKNQYFQGGTNGPRDFQPDLYFYNFLNYSGQFIFHEYPNAIPLKRGDGVLFKSNITDGQCGNGFEARDTAGNVFSFNDIESSDNYIGEGTNRPFSRVINSWYLSNIVSNKGKEVDFHYSEGAEIQGRKKRNTTTSIPTGHQVSNSNFQIINSNTCLDGNGYLRNLNGFCQHVFIADHILTIPPNSQTTSISQSYHRPILLDSISFDQGTILFKTTNRTDLKIHNSGIDSEKLSYVEIYNTYDELIKGFQLDYKYFNNKLILESLKEYNLVEGDTIFKKPYSFKYNENNNYTHSKDTENFDSWGYPNKGPIHNLEINTSITNNNIDDVYTPSNWTYEHLENVVSAVANDDEDINYTSAYPWDITEFNHTVDSLRNKLHSIEEISYPTGGKTIFNFETNDYRNSYDNFLTNFKHPTWKIDEFYQGYINSDCGTAPCSNKEKKVFRQNGSYTGIYIRNGSLYSNDSKDEFTLITESIVTLRFKLEGDMEKNYTIKGVLKNENMEPIISLGYNYNNRYRSNGPDHTGILDYLASDHLYSPEKRIKLPPGTYYYEIENYVQSNAYAEASLGVSILEEFDLDNTYFKLGGGLRVSNISNYDSNGQLIDKTEYDYKIEEVIDNTTIAKSSGKLLAPIKYNYEHDHISRNIPGDYGTFTHYSVEKIFSNPRPLTPMGSSANGQSIGYDQVTVRRKDRNGQNLGKVIYYYKNELETLSSDPRNAPNNKHLDNGQLILQKSFNDQNILVSSQENIYSKNNDNYYSYGINIRNEGMDNPRLNLTGGSSSPSSYYRKFKFTDYKIRSEWWHMDHSIETTYDLNGETPVVTSTDYEYDNDKSYQPTKTTVKTSKGDDIETIVYYPDDITSKGVLSIGGPLTQLEYDAINRLKANNDSDEVGADYQPATPIQTETTYNGSTSVERFHYYIYPSVSTALLSGISTATGSDPLEKQIEYVHYDTHGNPRELKRENGIHVVYVWGYEGEHLIAKIENATYSSLPTTLKGGNGHVGLLNEAIDLSDDDTNVAGEMQLLTKLDEIRNHTFLKDAMVTTYTYDPLIGMTNMVDSSGYKTSYTYDVHNRLHQVKDNEGNVISENQYNYKN